MYAIRSYYDHLGAEGEVLVTVDAGAGANEGDAGLRVGSKGRTAGALVSAGVAVTATAAQHQSQSRRQSQTGQLCPSHAILLFQG